MNPLNPLLLDSLLIPTVFEDTTDRPVGVSIDALWDGVRQRPELASGSADVTLARLADVATRRLVSVVDVFDNRNEELI